MFNGVEFEHSVEHDDRAGFSVVSGSSSQSGEYPGGEGERAFRVGILLPFGFSFKRLGDPLESGLIFEVKRILEGTPATSIALVNELKHGDCSNDTSGDKLLQRALFGLAQSLDVEALGLERSE